MRIMAVDFGDKRTGLAVSDMTRTIVGEAWVVQCCDMQGIVSAVAKEASKREVSTVVIGYPKNMDGTIGERAKKSEALADTLRKLLSSRVVSCPDPTTDVVLFDERLTTVSASKILSNVGKHGKKHKQTVDAVAASLILESYLDSLRTPKKK